MFQDYKIILASQSPRRRDLLKGLDLQFEVITHEVEEIYPDCLAKEEIPVYLAKLKAEPFSTDLDDHTVVISADTIVWIDGEVLGKPKDKPQAIEMLQKLSGTKHTVITGVCLTKKSKQTTFSASSEVYFKPLTNTEIEYYLDNYHPYDKAGSYGVQEWIGYIAIDKIEGSYFNVMGLPVHRLYEELSKF